MVKVLDRNADILVTRPNWSGGVNEEYSFKTSIFRSRDGTEKREAMRETARVAVQYLTVLKKAGMVRHMADLAEDQTRVFYLPARWRSVLAGTDGLLGNDFIAVETIEYWMVVGADIIISDGVSEEKHTILTVNASSLSLDGTTTGKAFPASSRVMPAYQVRAADQVDFEALLDNLFQANVRYDVVPGSNTQPALALTPDTFEGRDLFLTEPNWAGAPGVGFNALREIVDAGRGVTAVNSPVLDSTRLTRLSYTGMNKAQSDALVAFFLRQKGQRTGFFMPTWVDEIEVAGVEAAANGKLLVSGTEFKDAYEDSTVFNVLIAFWPDGSYQANRIASMALVGSDTDLTMTDPWDAETPSDIRVMFCHHWRFASDTLSVQWITNTTAEIEFTLSSVQAGEND